MARMRKSKMRAGLRMVGLVSVIGAIYGGLSASKRLLAHRPAYLDMPRATAVRADLQSSVVVGGGIDTAKKTVVECELEAYFSQSGRAGGISTIIELVPDGTMVKKGQMLARIDSSDYEELVRVNEIALLQAEADEQKARLDVKSAEISLREYRDGQLPQLRQYHQGQIVLNQADIRRAKDRLGWVHQMVTNGYLAQGQALSDRAALERSEVNLANVQGELATLDRFTAWVQLRRLELAVEGFRGELDFQALRLENRRDQLKKFRNQVEACTIRAPHDGMVIYATTYNPEARIEPGAMAYNHMNLFYLPDLTGTEVKVELNESDIRKVRRGQACKVRVNGLPSRMLGGHVKSVDQLAAEPKNWWLSREIRNFSAVIAIHSPPPGVLPGMSAEVLIQGDVRPAVLVVPSTAVTFEKGRDVVYVVGRDGLERRTVEVASGDTRNVEVRSGLGEGEEVIRDPSGLDPADILAAEDRGSHATGPDGVGIANAPEAEAVR